MFVILNSYIISQYITRIISNRIVNADTRASLNSKIFNTNSWGWGFECDSLTYKEYTELNKQESLLRIPPTASTIFYHQQYGLQDYNIELGYKVEKAFNPDEFYSNDTFILNRLLELRPDTSYYYYPPQFDTIETIVHFKRRPNWRIWSYGEEMFLNGKLDFDTTLYKYYLWLDYEI